MTEEQTIMMFNQLTGWTYEKWINSDARCIFNQIKKDVVEWICEYDMTEIEKTANPSHKTTGGYLKVLDTSECAQMWWDGLNEKEKGIIKQIPNFDKAIFEEVTGIQIEERKEV